MPDSALQLHRAVGERRLVALRILLSQFPVEEREARLADTLAAVERGALQLAGLWLAEQHGQPVGAALEMAQADGVSLVWLPVTTEPGDETLVRPALMDAICRDLDGPQVKFGQVLLSPAESEACGWLGQYGFEIAAELFFLARGLAEPLPDEANNDDAEETDSSNLKSQLTDPHHAADQFEVELFDEPRNFDRFARLVAATYDGSLDCPKLNGTRTGVDALAGHKLSGQFDPRGWRLYRQHDRDAAVLLLNEHPDQDAVELVYFGVAPEFRGQGWGRRLLADAVALSREWNRAAMFLAVDAANTPANRLYAEFGFQEVARRVVWLRFPAAPPRSAHEARSVGE